MKSFRKIKLWWKFEGRFYHKDFKNGVKNLIRWFPVIWKDRNWDSVYIFNILQHKLKLQAKYISTNDIHVDAQTDSQKMMLCTRLIEKIKTEFYEMEYADYHKTTWNFKFLTDDAKSELSKEGVDVEGLRELHVEEESEHFDDYFKKYPLIYKKVMNLPETGAGTFYFTNDSKEHIAMNMARINHERAKKLLFKVLDEHIERWWD